MKVLKCIPATYEHFAFDNVEWQICALVRCEEDEEEEEGVQYLSRLINISFECVVEHVHRRSAHTHTNTHTQQEERGG